jgi:hypothetical protein
VLTYPSEEEGQGGREGGRKGGREGGRDTFHVFMSAVKIALLVNLISHYVVDIS